MGKGAAIDGKPDMPKRLFWDFRYDQIEWNEEYLTIIARVLERGTKEEWKEIIRFCGEPKVIQALKKEINFLADYAIEEVCAYSNSARKNFYVIHGNSRDRDIGLNQKFDEGYGTDSI